MPSTIPSNPNSSLNQKHLKHHSFFSDTKDIIICLALSVLLVSAILFYLFFPSGRDIIHYDFTREVTSWQWQISGRDAQRHFSSQTGLSIKNTTPYHILSPLIGQNEPSGEKMEWRDYPYVRLRVDPTSEDRDAIFIWNPRKDLSRSIYFRFAIPAYTHTLVIDTQKRIPWERRRPFKGPIIQFGFALRQSATIKSITLLPGLKPFDHLKALAADFMTLEPYSPYSINASVGPYVSDTSLITCLGLAVILLGIVCFAHRSTFTKAILTGCTIACFLLFDIHHDITLLNHAEYSQKLSAWHYDKYEEYESRFGKEFSELAEVFETIVPPGSAVFFPKEKRIRVRGEINWMTFQFFPDYMATGEQKRKNAEAGLNAADYIFYYYPANYSYNEKEKRIVRGKSDEKDGVKVEILADLHKDVKLFRVIHD